MSSAYPCGRKLWVSISRSKSAMYSRNRIGPRTDPCGTQNRTEANVEVILPHRTYWLRPLRYDLNQLNTVPPRPYETSRRRRRVSWSTVSTIWSKNAVKVRCYNVNNFIRKKVLKASLKLFISWLQPKVPLQLYQSM